MESFSFGGKYVNSGVFWHGSKIKRKKIDPIGISLESMKQQQCYSSFPIFVVVCLFYLWQYVLVQCTTFVKCKASIWLENIWPHLKKRFSYCTETLAYATGGIPVYHCSKANKPFVQTFIFAGFMKLGGVGVEETNEIFKILLVMSDCRKKS